MKPPLPGLLPISLLMFTAVFATWLGLTGPVDFTRIERWQTLIGALITGTGILVASWNVTRQMRLTARAKEIDRIERDLPGMRDALHFVNRIAPPPPRILPTADVIVKRFNDLGITEDGIAIIKPIESALPKTYDSLRRNIIAHCFALRSSASSTSYYAKWLSEAKDNLQLERTDSPRLSMLKNEADQVEARHAEYNAAFLRNIQDFDVFRGSIREEVDRSQAQLDTLRKALQKHIDD